MEFNKAVFNPMLVGSIELMREDDSPEHKNMFIGELMKAELQVPAIIKPDPEEDEEGNLKLSPESKVQFPLLATKDGRKYYMGFTDAVEYSKWVEKNTDLPYFAMKIPDYFRLIFGKDSQGNTSPALGLVINPLGANVVIPKEMVGDLAFASMGIQPPRKKTAAKNPEEAMEGTSEAATE